jgi:hypothetical protein
MHVPWSPGTSSDDRLMVPRDLIVFHGQRVICTEKMDGENTTLYPNHIHARSVDSRNYPWQDWVRTMHSMIRNDIPTGWRVCGENMYARHSIRYDHLTTFFYVFSIWNDKNECLPWDDTVEYTMMLNDSLKDTGYSIATVPVLYDGIWDAGKIKSCWTGKSVFKDSLQEGYVVRTADGFPYPLPEKNPVDPKNEMAFFKALAKYVRKGHVQTGEHWRKTWVPNKLAA